MTTATAPRLTLRPDPARPRDPAPARGDDAAPEPWFVVEFRRLAAVVPKGQWPRVLPRRGIDLGEPLPLPLGLGDRVDALLPEGERPAWRKALFAYCRCRPYLQALAADMSCRWADDGSRALGAVSEEHRASATASLMAKAVSDLRKERVARTKAGGKP